MVAPDSPTSYMVTYPVGFGTFPPPPPPPPVPVPTSTPVHLHVLLLNIFLENLIVRTNEVGIAGGGLGPVCIGTQLPLMSLTCPLGQSSLGGITTSGTQFPSESL